MARVDNLLIQQGHDLADLNTLAVPSRAEFFCRVESVAELSAALVWAKANNLPVNLLAGGSNVILAHTLPGLTLMPALGGRQVQAIHDDGVLLRAGAGENWHELVRWSVSEGYYGLENLALIPGTVGAAPVQNIGAYGVELEQVFDHLHAYDCATGALVNMTKDACAFGYRDSIFKHSADRFVIVDVTLRLHRRKRVNLSYPALAQAITAPAPTPEQVYAAVCALRKSKLPMPEVLPNCGSFFKNPVISQAQFERLHSRFAHVAHFPAKQPNTVKVAAAWLIDQAGWKGREHCGVVVHASQALVLTNPKRLPATQVLACAADIQADVQQRFDIALELEPRCFGFA